MCAGVAIYARMNSRAHNYCVKGHLLAFPCGISSCKVVSNTQRREMEKEDHVGKGKVAATSKTQQNEDPLSCLRKPSSTRPPPRWYGSEVDAYPTWKTKRPTTSVPMDMIFQQEEREEVDLTIAFFFYLNFISFNVAWSPLFIEMCQSLIEQAPTGYVPPSSEKVRTTLLVKEKKEVDKILEPVRS